MKVLFLDIKPTIWFEVENLEDEYSKLKENGVKFLSEPFEIMTGMTVEFEDSFGNRLDITLKSAIPFYLHKNYHYKILR